MLKHSRVTLIRILLQSVLNHMSQNEVNFFGLAKLFTKCADICRAEAVASGELETKFQDVGGLDGRN